MCTCLMERYSTEVFMKIKPALILTGLVLLLLISCSIDGADESSGGSGGSAPVITEIPILETPEEVSDFVEEFDQPVHDYFYEYIVRFNRVNTLVNGALFADPEKTSLQTMVGLSDSAVSELDDFIAFCREMESWSKNTLKPAIEDAKAKLPDKTFSRSVVGGMSDTAYARRLVELMLDTDYGLDVTPEQISKRTGIEMGKIRFLMQQVSNELGDAVDNLEVDIQTEKMEMAETVRDTASAVNSTLALATPFGAFGATSAGTLASFGPGWIGKAKFGYAVLENTSAAITFTGNALNITVGGENIPTPVKDVLKYNGYAGFLFGGTGIATGDTKLDSALALIGTATDGINTFVPVDDDEDHAFIKVDDDEISISNMPQLDTTTPVDLNNYEDILPRGYYQIPSVDWDDWMPADFNWDQEGDSYWENLYNGIEDITEEAYANLEAAYAQFVIDWRSTHDPNPTEALTVGGIGLPSFFDIEDDDDVYADHDDLVITPDAADFTVAINTSGYTEVGSDYNVTFSAKPSSAFVRYRLKLTWDFGDGPTQTQTVGEAGFTPEITHTYSSAGVYTVKLQAEDIEGNTAKEEIVLPIGGDLQDIIDSYKGTETIISVPGGTYGGGDDGRLKIWENITLRGSKDDTVIDATIEMFPGSRIEGFTLKNTGGYRIIQMGDSSETEQDSWTEGDKWDIRIIGNIFEGSSGTAIYLNSSRGIIYTGEISGNSCTGGMSTFLDMSDFSGIISDNTLKNNAFFDINHAMDSTISENTLENSRGMTIHTLENTEVSDNIIKDTMMYYGIHFIEMIGDSVCTRNTVTGGTSSYIRGIYINSLEEGSSVTENTVTGTKSTGIKIDDMAGEVSENTFSGNDEYGLWIEEMLSTGVLQSNTISDNTDGGVRILKTEGTITDNTITVNTSYGIYVYLFKGGIISGNTITYNEGTGATIPSSDNGGLDPKPSPKIKDSNTIYGNLGTYNLWSVYEDDRIPKNS